MSAIVAADRAFPAAVAELGRSAKKRDIAIMSIASALVFPDGVRFANADEIPGPTEERLTEIKRIESAAIFSGYTLMESNDNSFKLYGEINVDAPAIWDVFVNLSQRLLGNQSTLIISGVDDAPVAAGTTATTKLIEILRKHKDQLSHDGYIQFGLVTQHEDLVTEIFITPTKHFRVWLNDEELFRSIMQDHGIEEAHELEFLDEYPRVTEQLPRERVTINDYHDNLAIQFQKEIETTAP